MFHEYECKSYLISFWIEGEWCFKVSFEAHTNERKQICKVHLLGVVHCKDRCFFGSVGIHVTKALWMEGVVSWANHIQAIHSQHPILRSTKLLRLLQKNFQRMKFGRWKINVCKMKGLIVHPTIWEHLCVILRVPNEFPNSPMEFSEGLVPLVLPLRRKR